MLYIPLNIKFALNETLKIYIVHRHKLKSMYCALALVEELYRSKSFNAVGSIIFNFSTTHVANFNFFNPFYELYDFVSNFHNCKKKTPGSYCY